MGYDYPTQSVASFAIFDEATDYEHRFLLIRHLAPTWPLGEKRWINYLLCNPSTATEAHNDATVARCERMALAWGYTTYSITNIFSYRARDPLAMKRAPAASLPENDDWILWALRAADITVCGWSDHGKHEGRHNAMVALLQDYPLHALKVNASGMPAHPVYLPGNVEPKPYTPAII